VLTQIGIVPSSSLAAAFNRGHVSLNTSGTRGGAYSEACRSAFRLMSITIPIDADRGSERMPIKKSAFSER
jgi:hypothetical protein